MIDGYFVNGPWASTYRALEDDRDVIVAISPEFGPSFWENPEMPVEPMQIKTGTYTKWYERLDGAVAFRYIPPSE